MQKDNKIWSNLKMAAKIFDIDLRNKIRSGAKKQAEIKRIANSAFLFSQSKLDPDLGKKDKNYLNIIDQHNLKKTRERISDFRSTLKEIVDVKNGIIPFDSMNIDTEQSIQDIGEPKNLSNI